MSHTILDTGFYSSKQNTSPQGVYIPMRGDRQIYLSLSVISVTQEINLDRWQLMSIELLFYIG